MIRVKQGHIYRTRNGRVGWVESIQSPTSELFPAYFSVLVGRLASCRLTMDGAYSSDQHTLTPYDIIEDLSARFVRPVDLNEQLVVGKAYLTIRGDIYHHGDQTPTRIAVAEIECIETSVSDICTAHRFNASVRLSRDGGLDTLFNHLKNIGDARIELSSSDVIVTLPNVDETTLSSLMEHYKGFTISFTAQRV